MRIDQSTVAVVTGAASGIGRALALHLARAGAALVLTDVRAAELAETARLTNSDRVTTHLIDVSDRESMAVFADAVVAQQGRVNLLINNAGVALAGTTAELALDDIEWLMSINFWGVVYGVKHFLPVLEQQPQAHIVNISSIFGIIAPPGQAAYAASKFAVRGFTEALRHELRQSGSRVRVSAVHPGGVRTNIARWARIGEGVPPASLQHEIDFFDQVARTTPEAAAARIVRGIERNEERIMVGIDARFIERVQRWLPVRYWGVLGPMLKLVVKQ
jgi:NAD(P)-dependent dehydrogenase (short-subunit alcohol dehydrogenase family)